MEPTLSNFWSFNDKEYRFDIYLAKDFSNLSNVEQAYTCVLNDEKDKILLVHNRMGLWLLPGGSIEEGESAISTAAREVKEETNCDIEEEEVIPFFYQKAFRKIDGEWVYQRTEVRYIAPISKYYDFVEDPDNGDIIETKWVEITELEKYLNWGDTVKMMKEELLKF